jgi:hypothetical protein
MPIRRSPNGARHTPPQPGRDRSEQVVAMNRNGRSQLIGISGRNHPVRAVDRGGRVYEVAELFEVSVSYIYRALARRRLRGLATALPKCGRPGRKLDHHLDALVAHVTAHPDATLAKLVEWSSAKRGVKVCIATM